MKDAPAGRRDRSDVYRWIVSLLCWLLAPAFLLGPWGLPNPDPWFRGAVLVAGGALGGLILPSRCGTRWWRAALGALSSSGLYWVGLRAASITRYPFSLSWSEGTHLWAESLFYRWRDYEGLTRDLWPRYVTVGLFGLQGLPFLLGQPSIMGLRIWQAALDTLPLLGLGAAVFLGERSWGPPPVQISLAISAALCVTQGPTYAPIVLAAIVVAICLRRGRWGRTLLVTLAVTFYLGISRWTWMIAPAIWVATWAVVAPSVPEAGRWRRAGACLLAGGVGALVSLLWIVGVERRPPFLYLIGLRHPMLWYRAFPNATSPLGILPWILLLCVPPGLCIVWAIVRGRDPLRWQRLAVVAVGSLALFTIGLLASLKMGGGDNLHHFDMLLIHIVLVAGALGAKSSSPDRPAEHKKGISPIYAAVLLLPIASLAALARGSPLPSSSVVEARLRTIRDAVAEAAGRGPILFIDERQLITFGLVPAVPEVWDYEQVELMDHAMARDEAYLARFHADLSDCRFGLIVSAPLHIIDRGQNYPFGEENDIWVETVVRPILEHYRPVAELDDVGVWLMEPIREAAPD
jgi:hypothetical protein